MIGSIILTAFLLLIVKFLYKWVISPYLWVQYYKKQGGVGYYAFNDRWHVNNKKNAILHGDYHHLYYSTMKKDPKVKFFVHNFGPRPYLILHDPKLVYEALKKYENFHKDVYGTYYFMKLETRGLTFLEDGEWKKKRKMMNSAFNFEFMSNFFPIMKATSHEKFEELNGLTDEQLKNFDILNFSTTIAGENIVAYFYGKEYAKVRVKDRNLTEVVVQLHNQFGNYHPSFCHNFLGPWFAELKLFKEHKEMMENIELVQQKGMKLIQLAREKGVQDNTTYLSFAFDQLKFSDKELLDDFILFFMAGTETVSHTTARATWFLWRYPEAFAKVKEEVDRIFANEDEVTLEKVNKMDYTLAFCKECLRLSAPIAMLFPRETVNDIEIEGVKIHKGTLVSVAVNTVGRDPRNFAEPEKFIPERWIPESDFAQSHPKMDQNLFLAFSGGPRYCIGRQFAYIELRVILAHLIKRFTWTFPESMNEFEKLNWDVGFSYLPVDGFFPDLKRRV